MMASVRMALLLLPPVSVVLVMAVRCLCRVAARKLSALASAYPSSFRYYLSVENKDGHAAMRELPVALYRRRSSASSCGGGDDEEELAAVLECVFCLSVVEEGSEVRELKCRHLFHRGCLDRWLLARPVATCPLCRCRLVAPPWEEEYDEDSDVDSDMMLFMACVHSRSSWLWPSS